jgi:hypothetical protein
MDKKAAIEPMEEKAIEKEVIKLNSQTTHNFFWEISIKY